MKTRIRALEARRAPSAELPELVIHREGTDPDGPEAVRVRIEPLGARHDDGCGNKAATRPTRGQARQRP